MPKAKVIFMGTPEFAVPSLRALSAREDIDLCLVVTQPDRPAGRGKKLVAPPVKDAALELDLPLLQTDSLRYPEVKQRIIDEAPDLVVVAAFSMILGKWILELPTHGCVNVHASLLPKYRGASPISAAILAGESTAGVTLMQIDRGLDTGDILYTIQIPIDAHDTTESLTPRLAVAGAELLDKHLREILDGSTVAIPQPEGATETRQLTKADGRIDWSKSAVEIERLVRAMWSWPRAWTELPDGTRMQIHLSEVAENQESQPGEMSLQDGSIIVGTGEGSLRLIRVQLPGGKPIEGHALIQKLTAHVGTALS